MDISLTELMGNAHPEHTATNYRQIEGTLSRNETVILQKGFFFLLVINGTASINDTYRHYNLSANQLVVVTPSLQSRLTDKSEDFWCTCLYIAPDYFDTLAVGQLVYNQVSSYIGNFRLPIFSLETEQAKYLRQTLHLFNSQLENMQLYQDGAIRHLCSFLLLQIADASYKKNRDTSGCVKHSSEIFRNFKRLLVHHYREQHTIWFYADRLNISTTYLSRIVKHITGHTVRFHISEMLCADARKMLECSDLDIKGIADKLGFSDQSVFGKFFMRKTGLSPMKFRMQKDRFKNVYTFSSKRTQVFIQTNSGFHSNELRFSSKRTFV